MGGNSIFSLAGLKLPYQSRSRLRQKNGHAGGTTLPSYAGDGEEDGEEEDKYNLRRVKWAANGTREVLSLGRIVKGFVLVVVVVVSPSPFLFPFECSAAVDGPERDGQQGYLIYRRHEIHIEIQIYKKGWISQTILPTPPLSSTCFDPSHLSSTSYNLTLSQSPSYVELHAGLSMTLGNDCFNFASTIPLKPLPEMILPKHTIFHTYWRADLLPLGRRQISLLHSLLATQDRSTTSLILWTNSDTTTHLQSHTLLKPLLSLYSTRFSIRTINKSQLSQGTPMENNKFLNLADKKAWLDGDLVRLLVLYQNGGMWIDMDTIMTGRDLRVLGESEWVTQWDCYGKPYQPLNGAMMHFYQHSPYICEMLYVMSTDPPPRRGTTDWGSILYQKVFRRLLATSSLSLNPIIKPFKILPYCFTDGHTCRLDNRLPDPFDKKSEKKWGKGRFEELEEKVAKVWAIHLHNQWEKEFPKDGWVRRIVLSRIQEAVGAYRLGGKKEGGDEGEGEGEGEDEDVKLRRQL